MEESSKLKKRSDGGVSSDNIRTSALDRLRAAKASLEEQKGKSASARTYKAHTMSSADRSEYFQLRNQMNAAAGSPDQDPAPRLQPQRSTDFLRRLREEKLGWQSGDSPQAAADGQGRAAADAPTPAAPASRSPEATGPVSGSGSGVGSFFREERKRLQESGVSRAGSGSLVRQSSTPAPAAADASVLDVLQAGTVELQSSSEKTNSPSISTSPALLKVSPWLSAKEQKRSLSSIKRTKDEKLKALEQLQSQLQQKRADINAQKEKQQHNDELLAKMVSKSIIIAPVVARGSRLVGKSIIVPRAEDAAQPKAAPPPLASKLATSAGGGPRMPAPQLTVTALEDEPAKGEGEKAKEKEKKTKSKVKELKKKKQEEKMMDDMERQLLRESKKMDEEKKNIQIDNQLSTFLTSLLTLESGFRTVEKEKIEALKKLDAADREREYLGTFLVCLLENVKRVHAGMQDVIQAHSAEAASESSATSLLADVMQRQQEMEEIVSATTSFLGSATLSSTASDQFQSSSALTSSSSSAALPSLSSFSSFASISDLRTSLSVPAVVEQPPAAAAPPATIDEQAPAPPVAPPAATSSTPPPPPPPAAEVPLPPSSPAAAPTSGGGESRGAVLAQIRTGGFDLKKVERRPPAPPPPSTAGNLFQSLQDTLVAAMNVRKLAMQGGDDDDPDDNEWD